MSALERAALAYADAHAAVGRARVELHAAKAGRITSPWTIHFLQVAHTRARGALAASTDALRRQARISGADA